MKTIHSFKNYERERTVVVTKRWHPKGKNKDLAGLYEPSINEEDAVISISEHLLKYPCFDQELALTTIHECLHCFFPTASESSVAECSSKVITLLKKFGFSLRRIEKKKTK